MRGMAFGEIAEVAKGGEGGKAGVADLGVFVGMLCAASICRLHHLYRLFSTGGWRSIFPHIDRRKKAQMLEAKWTENLCVLVVKICEVNQVR
jgi:hypothetical protein